MATYDSIVLVSANTQDTEQERSGNIDRYKFFAFVAVVLIHTSHALEAKGLSALGFVDQFSRFAVPFFFLASGYFLGLKGRVGIIEFKRRTGRIVTIFAFWSTFYVLLDQPSMEEFLSIKYLAKWALSGGPGYHLWFLPSLLICLGVFLALHSVFSPLKVWICALALYLLGVAFGTYRAALHLPDIHFNTHNGPFFGTLFVATGFLLAIAKPSISASLAVRLAVLGLAIHVGESVVLNALGLLPFSANEFSLGTIPFSIGVFAMALSSRKLGDESHTSVMLNKLGELSLGLYCVHVAYIWLFSKLFEKFGIFEVFTLCCWVVLASIATVLLLSKMKPLRGIIR